MPENLGWSWEQMPQNVAEVACQKRRHLPEHADYRSFIAPRLII